METSMFGKLSWPNLTFLTHHLAYYGSLFMIVFFYKSGINYLIKMEKGKKLWWVRSVNKLIYAKRYGTELFESSDFPIWDQKF